ncbi:MAG: accessory factor UbiK family protein [Zetaproteobacteria bacterium]|nr:accessory factor UbiK family protein [Zetaproteobacteria bacterium]
MNQAILDDISEKLAQGLRGLGNARQGLEKNVREIVESVFSQLDIVTSERMQVQEAMLKKAREEMITMEKRISELEALVKKQNSPSN